MQRSMTAVTCYARRRPCNLEPASMATTAAQRMAAYRSRQRALGLTALSLLVPKQDAQLFQRLAGQRRRLRSSREASRLIGRTSQFGAAGGPADSRARTLADALLGQIAGMGWP